MNESWILQKDPRFVKDLLLLITSIKNGLTYEDELQQEVEYADLENTPFRNAIDLHQFQLNPLRHQHRISKSSSTSKSASRSTSRRSTGTSFYGSLSGRHYEQKLTTTIP
jgi:hypothetical protein